MTRRTPFCFCVAALWVTTFSTPASADVAPPRDPTLEACEGREVGDACAFRCGDCGTASDDELPCFDRTDCSPASNERGDNFGVCSEAAQCTELTGEGPAGDDGDDDDDDDDGAASCAHTQTAKRAPLLAACAIAGLTVFIARRRASPPRAR